MQITDFSQLALGCREFYPGIGEKGTYYAGYVKERPFHFSAFVLGFLGRFLGGGLWVFH